MVNRTRTARKPVGSGSMTRPIVEHSPSIGQMKASPYVNARSPSLTSPPRLGELANSRPPSAGSLGSEEFFDTAGAPEHTSDHSFSHLAEYSDYYPAPEPARSGRRDHPNLSISENALRKTPETSLHSQSPQSAGSNSSLTSNLRLPVKKSPKIPNSRYHPDSPFQKSSDSSLMKESSKEPVQESVKEPVKEATKAADEEAREPTGVLNKKNSNEFASDDHFSGGFSSKFAPKQPASIGPASKEPSSNDPASKEPVSKGNSPKEPTKGSALTGPVIRQPAKTSMNERSWAKEPTGSSALKGATATEHAAHPILKGSEASGDSVLTGPLSRESPADLAVKDSPKESAPTTKDPKQMGHLSKERTKEVTERQPLRKDGDENSRMPLVPTKIPPSFTMDSRNETSASSSAKSTPFRNHSTPSLSVVTAPLDPRLPQSSHSSSHSPARQPGHSPSQASDQASPEQSYELNGQNYANWYDTRNNVEGLRGGNIDYSQAATSESLTQNYPQDNFYPYQYQDPHFSGSTGLQDQYSQSLQGQTYGEQDLTAGYNPQQYPQQYYGYDQYYDAYAQYYPFHASQDTTSSLEAQYKPALSNHQSRDYTHTNPADPAYLRDNVNLPGSSASALASALPVSAPVSTSNSSTTSHATSSASLARSSGSVSLDQDSESSKDRNSSFDSSSLSSVGVTQSHWQPINGGGASISSSTPSVNTAPFVANRSARYESDQTMRGTPEALHNLDSSGVNVDAVRNPSLNRLSNHGSGSDLSPRSSVAPDSPASVATHNSQRPATGGASKVESTATATPYNARNTMGSGSSASLSRNSREGPGSPTSVTNSPARALSLRSAHTRSDSTLGSSQIPEENEKDAVLGIGVGSNYVHRTRVDAGETHISRQPMVLPIGIRKKAKSSPINVKPEFLRRAMDIRYTHLPQRMLETEFDDDDGEEDLRSGIGNTRPSLGGSFESPRGSLTDSRRSSSPVESIVEQTGKIKLFVANPDND